MIWPVLGCPGHVCTFAPLGSLFSETDRDTNPRIKDLQVPEGVHLVIGRRLERVSEETQRVLTVAAVGRNFDLRVVLRVVESAADVDGDRLLDALEEAENAKLISSAASGRAVRCTFPTS